MAKPRNHALHSGMHAYSEREGVHDLYQTPLEAVLTLINGGGLPSGVKWWEPAAGRGAISKAMLDAGYDIVSTDKYDHGDHLVPIETGIDFYTATAAPPGCNGSLTNPPFMNNGPERFVEHGLTLCRHVIIFGRLLFPSSRRPVLESGTFVSCMPLKQRVQMMHRDGWQGSKATSQTDYAWFHFDREHDGSPAIIRRLDVPKLSALSSAPPQPARSRSPVAPPLLLRDPWDNQ